VADPAQRSRVRAQKHGAVVRALVGCRPDAPRAARVQLQGAHRVVRLHANRFSRCRSGRTRRRALPASVLLRGSPSAAV